MSETFLSNFMTAARLISGAERGMAVDTTLHVVNMVNVSKSDTAPTSSFCDFAMENLQEAMATGEPIFTNTEITDISQAPTTNVNLGNIRFVVAMPVADYGAVYLDQRIRTGIIHRFTIEKLMRLVVYLVDNGLEGSSPEEMIKLYGEVT